ncbi:ATP-binding cassette domain-containing protein [Magnetospirillum sp. SS-4]|uniref:ATP-binding cassette domain-containing protein n=1 Tax=Magnetospirillum sp. SS-4 TaxID=2681465 RepID=UPI001382CC45|nr:ATP-binding cassette domain-containing protein [Magnetospirillum sp. SS-4]CAA7613033.1 ABC transporter, transmembrane region:ABC transporter [Magnetospirillum sp. SS-4]
MNELLRRLFAHPLILTELLAASLFINLLGLATTVFVMLVLNRYVPYGVDATLVTLTMGVLLAAALEFGFREARIRLAAAVTGPSEALRGESAFAALAQTRVAVLERLPAGLLQEVMRGLDVVDRVFTPANLCAALDVPFAVLTLIALAFLSPLLAVLALGFMLASVATVVVGERLLKDVARGAGEGETQAQAALGAAINSADTLRAFNSGGQTIGLWRAARARVLAARRKLGERQSLVQSITQTVGVLQGIVIVTVGAVLAVKGDLSVGGLVGANILAGRALGPINRMAGMAEMFARADLALRRVHDFMRLPREQQSGMALKSVAGRLELVDVAFAHPGSSGPLAEHLSVRLDPGMVLAVSGPNGSGKTTLARLLMGLIEPARGQILVDGVELRQLSMEWWRKQVAYLPQEPELLDGTVEQAVRGANPGMGDDEFNRVLRAAGLRAWLDTSMDGIATPIVNGGRNLALGVRRRVALARALASRGRFVVFDEPTESLDAEGRQAVYAAMNELARSGATIVVFSHDPLVMRGATYLLDLGLKPVPSLTGPVLKDGGHG